MKTRKILNEIVHPFGFIVRIEIMEEKSSGPWETTWTMAYTPNGEYIGDIKIACDLYEKGIIPQLREPTHSACSIGFSTKDGAWYGWSRRAIFGFRIGSTYRSNEDYKDWIAKTIADAKQMACDFAESVS